MRAGRREGRPVSWRHTLEEVGKQFDVTRERIRQIEAKALRKLRHPSRSEKLRSFSKESSRPAKTIRGPHSTAQFTSIDRHVPLRRAIVSVHPRHVHHLSGNSENPVCASACQSEDAR